MTRIYNVCILNCEGISDANRMLQTIADAFDVKPDGDFDSLLEHIDAIVPFGTCLILYNKQNFADLDEDFKFNTSIWDFDRKNANLRIYDDYIKHSLSAQTFGDLFLDTPRQYGLRGDIHLWEELTDFFSDVQLPDDEVDIPEIIIKAGNELTGQYFHEVKTYFIKRYDTGGMSSGTIYSDFWLNKAIPLMIARYRIAKFPEKFNFKNHKQDLEDNAITVKIKPIACTTIIAILMILLVITVFLLYNIT